MSNTSIRQLCRFCGKVTEWNSDAPLSKETIVEFVCCGCGENTFLQLTDNPGEQFCDLYRRNVVKIPIQIEPAAELKAGDIIQTALGSGMVVDPRMDEHFRVPIALKGAFTHTPAPPHPPPQP